MHDDAFIFLTGASDPSLGLKASSLDPILGPTTARGVLLIADCCGGADIAAHAPGFFRAPHQNEFRLFVSASRAQQSSWELPGSQKSLFTNRLLEVLSGRVKLGNRGELYYIDLYRHLHTAVQEDAQKYLGDRNRQEPVAIGIHVGDPLLFLHRDQTLSQVRVNTQRLTQEYLRKRVIVVVSSLLAVVGLAMAGYWAFMDGHQFLHLGDKVTLVHGYPGLSGFKLPRDDWQFEFGAEAIDPSKALAHGDVVLPRGRNAFNALGPILRPGPRALLLSWQGNYSQALRILLERTESSADFEAQRVLDFLPLEGHEAELSNLIPKLPPNDSIAAVKALARVDSELAMSAFENSGLRGNAGCELNLLSSWSSPCSPGVQAWLDGITEHADRIRARTAALTTVSAGCRYSPNLISHDAGGQDGVLALRLTQPWAVASITMPFVAEVEDLAALGSKSLRKSHPLRVTPDQTLLALNVVRQLETMSCLSSLLSINETDVFGDQGQEAAMAIVEVVVKGCNQYRIEAGYDSGFLTIAVMTNKGERPRILGVPANPTMFRALDMEIRRSR